MRRGTKINSLFLYLDSTTIIPAPILTLVTATWTAKCNRSPFGIIKVIITFHSDYWKRIWSTSHEKCRDRPSLMKFSTFSQSFTFPRLLRTLYFLHPILLPYLLRPRYERYRYYDHSNVFIPSLKVTLLFSMLKNAYQFPVMHLNNMKMLTWGRDMITHTSIHFSRPCLHNYTQ